MKVIAQPMDRPRNERRYLGEVELGEFTVGAAPLSEQIAAQFGISKDRALVGRVEHRNDPERRYYLLIVTPE
jgi:hypothetical protein